MTRRLAVLGTGGTIASTDVGHGAVPTRSVADLVRSVAEEVGAQLAVHQDVLQVNSAAMTPMDMWAVVTRAHELVAGEEVDGVVITHGTATIEETSYLADLTWPHEAPIVFTGAMVRPDLPGSDGPRNLRDALSVVAHDATRGLGALLVANGEVHTARHVRKQHASAVETFSSGRYGCIGFVDEGSVFVHRVRRDRHTFKISGPVTDVPLIKAYTGMDERFLRLAHDTGAAGVVLECFPGRGGLPPMLLPSVRALVRDGVPVVLAGPAEGRVSQAYGGAAGMRTFAEAGGIPAGDLYPVKARILLMVLLAWTGGDLGSIAATVRTVAP